MLLLEILFGKAPVEEEDDEQVANNDQHLQGQYEADHA